MKTETLPNRVELYDALLAAGLINCKAYYGAHLVRVRGGSEEKGEGVRRGRRVRRVRRVREERERGGEGRGGGGGGGEGEEEGGEGGRKGREERERDCNSSLLISIWGGRGVTYQCIFTLCFWLAVLIHALRQVINDILVSTAVSTNLP